MIETIETLAVVFCGIWIFAAPFCLPSILKEHENELNYYVLTFLCVFYPATMGLLIRKRLYD
jgi:hypothetical protein